TYQVPQAQIETQIGSDKDIVDLDSSNQETSINIVGAKAFSYAHLRKLFGTKSYTPKAWALPFHVYNWFVQNFNIETEVEKLVADYHSTKSLSSKELEERLFQIRKLFTSKVQTNEFLNSVFYQNLIKNLPLLIKATLEEGHGELWDHSKGTIRFRSSTNAEDLIG
ncbi:MAG: hypothetical protein HQK51_18745, partial [Oligoflexia bacterium]|nr:hypothetical protein [Oligoflexia bacterium]